MQTALVIAVGGALGALSRYSLGVWISNKWNSSFPLHTFLINISGAFLLGFLHILFVERLNVSPFWRLGIGVGFLGAFTTFSTFGFEVISLLEGGSFITAGLYVILSIVVGFSGVALGVNLARLF
ncbi:camphor resistance protein CrcB [Desulfosporosinus sp. HMP52]|uniref:fluoride efflux transporter CrcB n=1 Tax=Desulfosporosinus sp. HMP52 TaxID=1487923 RepID=UPI00051FEE50|nr:fluoride efflux transporter CrcB [Desulfosporosinus sp. HMP52]KGK87818.1 camphor resistance protein CrcB [Desulfosporosinus sp. HMP52]